MKIAVNTRLLLPGRIEGISRFMFETLSRIVRAHPEHEFLFLFDRKWSSEFLFADNVTPISMPPPARHPILWYLWHEIAVPRALKRYKADLFYSPDGMLTTAHLCPNAFTLHDINFAHKDEYAPGLVGKFYRHYVPKYIANTNRLSTVSRFSARDIAQVYGVHESEIDVVYNATSSTFQPRKQAASTLGKQLSNLPGYFLFVGRIHDRKNPVGLVQAFAQFKQFDQRGVKLVFAGAPMFDDGPLHAAIKEHNLGEDIIFTGRLSEEELNDAYCFATALTFVPFFEGFGIPVIEAMKCETPVISSTATSLPEVCGEAAILVDPNDINGIAQSMINLDSNRMLRDKLVKKGKDQLKKFSWDQSALDLWDSLERALA